MNNQQAIELLKDIVRIDTVAGNEKEVTDLIANLFKEHGISSEVLEYSPGRHNLIVEVKGSQVGDKILGLSGHTDVVPVGDIKWERDPFSGDEADGRIYGRGSADMKSGVAALVATILRLNEKGLPFAGKIKLLLSVGEETSAIGSGQLTAEGYADDLDAMLIAESTANNILHAHKGAFWLRFTTYGQTAHGSMPQAGVNAIEHMLTLMTTFNETFDFSKSKDDLLGESTASLDVFNGGHGTNVIPDKCVAEIDIRTVPGQEHEVILSRAQEMLAHLSKEIPNFRGEVEVLNDLAPVHTPVDDPVITLLANLIKKTTDKEAVITILPGYTDAAQFVKAEKEFPIVIYGPGDISQAHQPDESTDISMYLESIKVFEEFIQAYLT